LGDVPRERFLGEPNDGAVRVDNVSHQLTAEHSFSAAWRGRAALAYKAGDLRGFSTEPQASLQDATTLRRQRRFRDYTSSDQVLQAEMLGKQALGGTQHELLIGVESFRFTIDQLLLRINPSATAPYAINIFNPQYGQPQPTPLANTDTRERQTNRALYLQDTVSIGAWRVVAGARLDRYEQSLNNRRTGVTTTQSPSETSPRLGLSYLPDDQVTLFANAGKSFRPNVGAAANGSAFAPESGRALELGVKWENRAKNLGATVAFFDIRKKNVVTADPSNPGFSITAGEVVSRGFDADLSGQLTRQWRINASLSHIDAKVERDNTLQVGGRLLNIPKTNGSVLLVYEGALSQEQRFGVGGGITHSGSRLGEARTQAQANAGAAVFDLPAYTTAKLVAYWRYSPLLRFSLDVDNATDKTYYANSFQRTWVMPGAARSVVLGVQAKF
jgi:iron complex outermembrane receptor protein